MMKPLARVTMMIMTLGLLITTSGCFHHHKHVRQRPPEPETTSAPKVQYLPQWLFPSQNVSTSNKIYTYQYYPTTNIYYDTTRKLYFFTDGEDWQEDRKLPPQFIINQNEAVTVRLKTDKPFLSDVSRTFQDNVTW